MAMRHNPGNNLTTQGQQHPLDLFRRQFDSLFNRMWGGLPLALDREDLESLRVWDFNVTENDRELTIRAEMPGFEDKDIEVNLDNDMLTIRAEKEQKEGGREEFRRFSRAVTLPAGIEADKVTACYKNGVLELHIPRPEGRQPRRIHLHGGQEKTNPEVKTAAAPKEGKQK